MYPVCHGLTIFVRWLIAHEVIKYGCTVKECILLQGMASGVLGQPLLAEWILTWIGFRKKAGVSS